VAKAQAEAQHSQGGQEGLAMRFNEQTAQWEHPREVEDLRGVLPGDDLPPSLRSVIEEHAAERERLEGKIAEADQTSTGLYEQLVATRETLRATEAERDRLRETAEAVRECLGVAMEDLDGDDDSRMQAINDAIVILNAALAAREATGGETK
jgi:chromosome segregation ATPase